jgi:hypothetical protein
LRPPPALAKAGEALGAIFTPSRIVLAASGTGAIALIETHLRRALEAGVVADMRYKVEIEVIPIDTDMIIKGTINQALRHVDLDIFAIGPLARQGREPESVS